MRKLIIALAQLTVTGVAIAAAQPGDGYPNRVIRMLVSSATGGQADSAARLFGQKLFEHWGQQVVVDARGGANGNIAAEILAKSEPDGYTIMMGTIGVLAINRSLYRKMGYDQLRDFAPVAQIVTFAHLLAANPNLPFTTVTELIAYAKANPGKLNYGSPGVGSSNHMAMELFARMAGIKLMHVAYKGSAQATGDVMGGQLQLIFSPPNTTLGPVRAGRLRALGVSSLTRLPAAPEIPPISEAGLPGFVTTSYLGIVAPARAPVSIINRLNAEINRIAGLPDIQTRLETMGAQVKPGTPSEFGAFIRNETAQWAKLVAEAGIKGE